jgi:hypothetical protein
MCEHGNEIICKVPIDPDLSFTGKMRWEKRGIDACIAPIINALNNAGIYTANCCCGHGKYDSTILLHDGRLLLIRKKRTIDVSQKSKSE